MNKHHLFPAVFVAGALAVLWVAAGFVGSNTLALAMTLVIGGVYAFGAYELLLFRRATATLNAALAALPERLDMLGPLHEWLDRVHPSLRNPVRLRVEGERVGLPGPALTPYLAGLLVMLGMLGTFVGMVVTFNGAVFALEGTTDLAAIRAALAAPIKGLGLAFGTSVAGVAASAMLGLMAALARRERMQAGQQLDGRIATVLRGFSLTHQRQETFKALQSQAQALPQVVDRMQALMAQMERMNQQLGEQLSDRLLHNQESFHGEIRSVYGELARSVDQSLRDSLTQGAQAAGASLQPVVEAAMTGIARDAQAMHQRVVDTAQRQLDGLAARFDATAASVADTWTAALVSHERSSSTTVDGVGRTLEAFAAGFEQRSAALLAAFNEAYATLQANRAAEDRQQMDAWKNALEAMAAALQREWQQVGAQTLAQQQEICTTLSGTAQQIAAQAHATASGTLGEIARLTAGAEDLTRARIAAEADWLQQHGERMDQLTAALRAELGALRSEEAQRGNAAVERLGELQAALAGHLTTLGTALEAPIARLMETAAEAPRAAAEVIGQLRQEISNSVARDNELLEERSRILETLNALLASITHASTEQRAVIDALVASSAVALDNAGSRFAAQVGTETAKLSEVAAQVTGSAVEVASLGEAFGQAVHAFGTANEKLIDNLLRIETALDKSMVRSEEQLAYYVTQAREVIDLSIMSQKEIFDELRQLPGRQAPLAAGAN